jgi:predicted MFS family arabinose efflux permease
VVLLRDRDFRMLWTATSVSEFGTQLSDLAVPLLVISSMHASTLTVGLLVSAETAAFALIGLPAGAWVDRLRRRPVLVAADALRAVLLASVPIAWWLGVLSLAQVFGVALGTGFCTVFFDVAYQSHLPDLVDHADLVTANAQIEVSASAAAVSGPAIGGAVVQVLSAPVAIAADAVSYVLSALLVCRIRRPEPAPPPATGTGLIAQVLEGIRFVVRHPLLRPIATCTAVFNLASSMMAAVFVLFLVRTLHQSAGTVGLLLALTSIGGLLGAATASRMARAVGQARAIWLGPALTNPFFLLIPAARPGRLLVLVVVGSFVGVIGVVWYNVAQVSLRQVITPARLLGRMNASMRFLVWGPRPIGAALGGVMGAAIGIRPTLWVGVIGMQASLLPLLLSPLRRMRTAPAT